MDKRGVSGVVVTVILIGITLSAVTVVWTITNDYFGKHMRASETCSDLFQKITINRDYSCFNISSRELHISIDREDVELEKLLIFVSAASNATEIELNESPHTIEGLRPYGGNYGDGVSLPGRNEGRTYILNLTNASLTAKPSEIQIVPVINSVTCPRVDALRTKEDCRVFK